MSPLFYAVGASSYILRSKITNNFWNTQIILHFFVFLLHIARLVYYHAICECKGIIKKRKAQRFESLRPN